MNTYEMGYKKNPQVEQSTDAYIKQLENAAKYLIRKSVRALRWIPQHDDLYGDLNQAIAEFEKIIR